MRNIRLYILVAMGFIIGLCGLAKADTLDHIARRGELRVVCQTQGPPFSFIDKDGKRTGSSIELCRMMAGEMGVKIKILNFDWDGLIPALLSKKADILAADMTPTLKRAMKIAFCDPFMYTGSIVFTKEGGRFNSIDDCRSEGVTIAVILGSIGETEAKKAFPLAKIKSYKGGGPLLINAVLKGYADIGINDNSAVRGQVTNFPPHSIKILPGQLSRTPLAFAVRYDSLDLLEWINLFFLHIQLDGRLEQNMNYWVNTLDWKKEH